MVGVPHETWGEVGRAFIVVGEGYDEAALRAFLQERLARYKLPKGAVFVDEIPRNPSGKILKRVLREQYSDPAPE